MCPEQTPAQQPNSPAAGTLWGRKAELAHLGAAQGMKPNGPSGLHLYSKVSRCGRLCKHSDLFSWGNLLHGFPQRALPYLGLSVKSLKQTVAPKRLVPYTRPTLVPLFLSNSIALWSQGLPTTPTANSVLGEWPPQMPLSSS